MAKAKQRFAAIEDPQGVEWQEAANAAWAEAEALAEKSRRHPLDHYAGYIDRSKKGREEKVEGIAPALPDFGADAAPAVRGEVLGRFVLTEDTRIVHDVTRATAKCRIETVPRTFIHFAHEIEGAVPEDAAPCPACMA